MKKIAINGFGRIGRTIARINAEKKNYKLVAINDIIPLKENLGYLLKFDSTYGRFPGKIKSVDNGLKINGDLVKIYHEKNLDNIPWDELDVDIVIDSSGVDNNNIIARELVDNKKFKKFIYTMSSENVDNEIIMGVNEESIMKSDNVFSSSICDANAIAHLLELIDSNFDIVSGSVTTLHPWLSYQNLVDGAAKGIAPDVNKFTPSHIKNNFGLGRTSVGAIIPKDTTAVTATEKVLTNIKGKLIAHSFRVPTQVVSCSDILLRTKTNIDLKDFEKLVQEKYKNSKYVRLNYESAISIDYEKEECSAVLDMQWLKVKKDMIKFVVWYDNEWGYCERVHDLAAVLL